MDSKKSVGTRLREERARLGFNIRDFAEAGGVSRTTQSNYENDVSRPDAVYLNRISALGAEIFWIMSGEQEDDEQRDKRASPYSPEIRELIDDYQLCSDAIKQAVKTITKSDADHKRMAVADFKKKHGSSSIFIPAPKDT